MAYSYNIPKHRRGDTWDGINTIGVQVNGTPIDLSGSQIDMQLRVDYAAPAVFTFSTTTSTISILPSLSAFSILPTIIEVPPATYLYDIQIKFANGTVKTYLYGKWEIYFDITR